MRFVAAVLLPAAMYRPLGGPRCITMQADEPDMDVLKSRIAEVSAGECIAKAVVLRETMVPGQRLRITAPPSLVQTFTASRGTPVVLLSNQGGRQSTRGVEVMLAAPPSYRPVVPNIHPEGTADIVMVAGRVCDVVGNLITGVSVSRPARVRWVVLDAAAEAPPPAVVARAERLAERVQTWIGLVRRACRERTPTHLDDVLSELGPMPEPERPNARALWVAGVINPSPALGASSSKKIAAMGASVAPEIRLSTLTAASVEARLSSVEMGLSESIRRLQKIIEQEE